MKRDQFIRQLRKEAKNRDLGFSLNKKLGKGSHYRVTVGSRSSTVQSGDLTPTRMQTIRRQLGLD